MSEISAIDDYKDRLGERIECEGSYGIIRYVGPVATSQKADAVWFGIEWEAQNRGKHDGSVVTSDGQVQMQNTTVRYYTCPPNQGSFIKPPKAKFGRDLLNVIKDRFALDVKYDIYIILYSLYLFIYDLKEQNLIEESSNYKYQFVGWDKSIRKAHQLENKRQIYVDQHDTAYIDLSTCEEIKQQMPCVEVLDLRRNYLCSWSTLHGFKAFESLIELNLSNNALNVLYFREHLSKSKGKIEECKANLFKPFENAFPLLQRLFLNDTCSPIEREQTFSTTWWVVYHLALYKCLPQLRELQLCSNRLSHFSLPLNLHCENGEEKLFEPSSEHIAQLFPWLQTLNISDNPISDWKIMPNTFGDLPLLTKLLCSYAFFDRIFYVNNKFEKLEVFWIRSNKINSLEIFDELNKFPNLKHLLIIENPLSKEISELAIRDFAIAKMAKLTVCNSSGITDKERKDAEIYYLKWIKNQWEDMHTNTNATEEEKKVNDTNENDEIEKKFSRFKELQKKWGEPKLKKTTKQNIDTVSVTIRSMDPKSITSQPLEKNLPLSITVGQLKMLCKRSFQLGTMYQQLMLRNSGDMFPVSLSDDMQTLKYYGIKDGAEILMQSTKTE
ncbi:hypothetical protein RFI_22840 [Reticulomyxa filosa]|uniref:Ubiquitin-like domain-containing protein n=1 Tax=Reticulomyxa filosa TaxID=46433 RepID=X6MN53_RETFI|nr:hypothetical protein RFI_22840 [Reticulomyxa filosa]|eukprot:ETO14525.1 hypothetical protein RFI_22840 [Reticulomyxa filosa]